MKVRSWILVIAFGFSLVPGVAGASVNARAPKACIRALEAAEQVAQISARFAEAVSTFQGEMSDSAGRNADYGISGVTAFLEDITAANVTMTSTVDSLTFELTPLVARYNRNAAKCRRA